MSENCACVWVETGDCEPDFYNDTRRRARKVHQCEECGREIAAGEEYEFVTGKWDGSISVYKTCADCLSIRDSFFCDGWLHGGMWEALDEHLCDIGGVVASSCLEALTPAARARVIERIDDLWDGDDEE